MEFNFSFCPIASLGINLSKSMHIIDHLLLSFLLSNPILKIYVDFCGCLTASS
jgi:hypothetical protein